MSLASLYQDHLREISRRADRALERSGFDALAVHSGAPIIRFLDDQSYPFVVNPHFRAWVPASAPHSWLFYQPGQRAKVVFYQPSDYWHSTPATPTDHWVEEVDLIVTHEPDAARQHLPSGRLAAIGEPGTMPDWDWDFTDLNPSLLLASLHYDRAIKTDYEIECMRRATTLGVRGHRAAARAFEAGASEFEIHVAYLQATGTTEAELPYSNIIALNEHAAVLHHTVLDTQAPTGADRRSFLIDAGAAFRGYACDITRTHTTRRDGVYRALIDAVDDLQQELCGRVRAGTDYAEIHLAAHHGIAGILRDAGIVDAKPDEAVETGLSAVFFPHGIGHLIGLQVHDVAGFMVDRQGQQKPAPAGHPYLRLTRRLEPGFVVTIEPGIYFVPLLLEQAQRSDHRTRIDWHVVEQLVPYGGIRIEDDVVCTVEAPENLTRSAFAKSG